MLANTCSINSIHGFPPFSSSLPQSLATRSRNLSFASSCQLCNRSRKYHFDSLYPLRTLSQRRRRRPGIRASGNVSAEADVFNDDGAASVPQRYSVKIPVGGRHVSNVSMLDFIQFPEFKFLVTLCLLLFFNYVKAFSLLAFVISVVPRIEEIWIVADFGRDGAYWEAS